MLHTRCASLLGPQGRFDLTNQVSIYSAHNQIIFFLPRCVKGQATFSELGQDCGEDWGLVQLLTIEVRALEFVRLAMNGQDPFFHHKQK